MTPSELGEHQFFHFMQGLDPGQMQQMLWFLSGYCPRGFDASYELIARQNELADAEASLANPYGGQAKHGEFTAASAAEVAEGVEPLTISPETIAEVARVANEYPDGVHTCAELQQLEPGRRSCTCGRCAAPLAPYRLRSLERPADGAA